MNTEDKIVEFIKAYGVACGGNWAGMLMSAIKHGMPEVWETLEDREYSFGQLWAIIGAELEKEEE